MEIKLKRLNDKLAFAAENKDGKKVLIDASPAIGGEGLGMRPMELLASSLAACASIDVLLILQKKRIIPEHFEVKVTAKRRDTVPASFESIHLQFETGEKDPQEQIEKAIQLSVEKYCSVAASLSSDIKVTYQVSSL
ncbi:MAG: OsmC family protein [Crocinitomicaceae bacterium]|jgi:putative redox protein|nr:OsmC family protein [Crocinitomicaceae bacterium]